MKKRRFLSMILCACLLLGSIAMPVQAAPKPRFVYVEEENVIKLQNADGTWAVNTWIDEFGHRYHTGENGALQAGWTELEGQTYFFYSTGAMATGWTTLGEDIYYFGADEAVKMIDWAAIGKQNPLTE